MIEPMGDAELEVWHGVLARREYGSRTLDVYASAMTRIIARLDAERSRADAAEAERDAAPGDAHHG